MDKLQLNKLFKSENMGSSAAGIVGIESLPKVKKTVLKQEKPKEIFDINNLKPYKK